MILGLWIISISGILLVFAVLLCMMVVLFLPKDRCSTDGSAALTLNCFTGFTGTSLTCVTGPTGPQGLNTVTGQTGSFGFTGPRGFDLLPDAHGNLTDAIIANIQAGPAPYLFVVENDNRSNTLIPLSLSGNQSLKLLMWSGSTWFIKGQFTGNPNFQTGDTGPTGATGIKGPQGGNAAFGPTGPTSNPLNGTGPTGSSALLGPGSLFGDASSLAYENNLLNFETSTFSSNQTFTGDVYYDNLIIPSGITVFTNGYRLFCRSSLDLNGTLVCAGSDGLDAGIAGFLGGTGAPSGSLNGGGRGGSYQGTGSCEDAPAGNFGAAGPSLYAYKAGFFQGGNTTCLPSAPINYTVFTRATTVNNYVGEVDDFFFNAVAGYARTTQATFANDPTQSFLIMVTFDKRGDSQSPPGLYFSNLTNSLLYFIPAYNRWEQISTYWGTVNDAFFDISIPSSPMNAFCDCALNLNPTNPVPFKAAVVTDSRADLNTPVTLVGNQFGNIVVCDCKTKLWSSGGPVLNPGVPVVAARSANNCPGGIGGVTVVNTLPRNAEALNGILNPKLCPGVTVRISGGSGGGGALFTDGNTNKPGGGGGGGVISVSTNELKGSGTIDVHGGDSGLNSASAGYGNSGGGGGGFVLIKALVNTSSLTFNLAGGLSKLDAGFDPVAKGQDGFVLYV